MISEDEPESTGIRGAGLVSGGRIAQQKLLVDPRSIRATTYAKGLKDHSRHAEAVPMSSAPSVNFEIFDMVEGVGRGALAVTIELCV